MSVSEVGWLALHWSLSRRFASGKLVRLQSTQVAHTDSSTNSQLVLLMGMRSVPPPATAWWYWPHPAT